MQKFVPAFLFAAFLTSSAECHAQSLFGSSGALGSTASANGGSSSGGQSSGAGSSGSSSGLFGSSSGSGGSSRAGQSGNGSNNTSLGQTSQLNAADGSLGATIGTSGFVGRGDNSSRFVGSQNASATNRRTNGANQFSALQAVAANSNFSRDENAVTSVTPKIVPQVRLGFPISIAPQTALETTLQTRLLSLPGLGDRAANVAASTDDQGRVLLTGTVESQDDFHLMETLVRMEPGVRSVKNQITIVSASKSPTPFPLR